jgi:transposase
MLSKNNKLDFTGQAIYIGMDTHKKQFTVTIQGEHLTYKTFTQPPHPKVLIDYVKRNYPGADYYAAYEAGFSGFWIQEELQSGGVDCIVVNPSDVPTTDKERKQKRDPLDSQKIARSLKNGELNAIHIPDKKSQQDRSLLRMRQRIVGNQTRCRNRIKGLLSFYGIEFPEQFNSSGSHWSKRFMAWLMRLGLGHNSGNTTLSLLLNEAKFLRDLLLKADSDIRLLSREDKYIEQVKLLLTVPGIGRLTAMIFLTEIGDVKRFKNLDHLCSYVGLIPNIYASGEKEKTGDITKRGNSRLKSHLIESSWVAARNDPALSLRYNELCSRMSGNKAIIRIARKLLSRIRYVLVNKQEYVLALTA